MSRYRSCADSSWWGDPQNPESERLWRDFQGMRNKPPVNESPNPEAASPPASLATSIDHSPTPQPSRVRPQAAVSVRYTANFFWEMREMPAPSSPAESGKWAALLRESELDVWLENATEAEKAAYRAAVDDVIEREKALERKRREKEWEEEREANERRWKERQQLRLEDTRDPEETRRAEAQARAREDVQRERERERDRRLQEQADEERRQREIDNSPYGREF